MIIYQVLNFRNFDSFPNCQSLKICGFSKLNNFRNSIIFGICQSWKFDDYRNVKFGKFSEFYNFEN